MNDLGAVKELFFISSLTVNASDFLGCGNDLALSQFGEFNGFCKGNY